MCRNRPGLCVFEDVHLQAGPVKREEAQSLDLKQQCGIPSYKRCREHGKTESSVITPRMHTLQGVVLNVKG